MPGPIQPPAFGVAVVGPRIQAYPGGIAVLLVAQRAERHTLLFAGVSVHKNGVILFTPGARSRELQEPVVGWVIYNHFYDMMFIYNISIL